MTGWRSGFASNPILAPHFGRWIINTESCASQISQWAAVEAIGGQQEPPAAMKNEFHARRDLIVKLGNEVPGDGEHVPFSDAAARERIAEGVGRMRDFIVKNTH